MPTIGWKNYWYGKYKILAKKEEEKNVYFVGRLANYKYFNMDEAIANSLSFFENNILPIHSTK